MLMASARHRVPELPRPTANPFWADGSRQLTGSTATTTTSEGLRWAIDRGDAKTALRLVASLWRFWQLRGHLDEGRQWAEAALALSVTRPDCCGAVCRPGRRRRPPLLASRHDRIDGSVRRGPGTRSRSGRRCPDRRGARKPEHDDCVNRPHRRCRDDALRGHGVGEQLGDRDAVGVLEFGDAYRIALEGRLDESYAGFDRAAALFREIGNVYWEATSLHGLGQVRRLGGDAASAEPLYREALVRLNGLGDRAGVAVELDLLSVAAIMLGDPVRGMRLAGAASVLRDALGAGQLLEVQIYSPPTERSWVFDPVVAGGALAEGRSWSLAAAVAYALGPDAGPSTARSELVIDPPGSALPASSVGPAIETRQEPPREIWVSKAIGPVSSLFRR